jgi:hypothetical protein
MWCVWGPSRRVHPRSVSAVMMLVLAAFGVALAGCSGSALTDSCGVVGRERSCECTGRSIGIQTCQFDGAWEPCTCYSVGGAGAASGSGGMGGAIAGSGGGSAGTSSRSSAVEAARAGRGGSRGIFPFSSAAGRSSRRD